MITEYLAIYRQPLDQLIEEQIIRYCSKTPLTPPSDVALNNLEIICGAVFEIDIRLFWFRDPDAATMLRLFDSVPIYIGRFDAMQISSFEVFRQSIERQQSLMDSALCLKAELGNHRTDLKNICKCSRAVFPSDIESDMVDILNKTNAIICGHIQTFLAEHRARL